MKFSIDLVSWTIGLSVFYDGEILVIRTLCFCWHKSFGSFYQMMDEILEDEKEHSPIGANLPPNN